MGITKSTNICVNNGIEIIAILNKLTLMSEQLKVIKILSGLVLHLFMKSLCSNIPFEMTIANSKAILKGGIFVERQW